MTCDSVQDLDLIIIDAPKAAARVSEISRSPLMAAGHGRCVYLKLYAVLPFIRRRTISVFHAEP